MAKPLLMLKMVNLKKVATKKKAPVKKKKKVPKNPNPVRLSPFKVGDKVWIQRYSGEWIRTDITKCISPIRTKGEIHWKYNVKNKNLPEASDNEVVESILLPDQIFTLMASDVAKMKVAMFADALNKVFDANVMVFGVYRLGQKKPWAYYVIPDDRVLWKMEKHKCFPTGSPSYTYDDETKVYVRPIDRLDLKLIPVSSAPQEILTYLGLHIYSRKWVKHGSDQETIHPS